jgi:N,N'-diacetyllegionaminate synthase
MFIAEIGLNHRGNYQLALEYVDSLLATKVDAITLQVREPGFYVNEHNHSELTLAEYEDIKQRINDSKKLFGLAICDLRLSLYPDPDFVKILSKDLDNLEFINEISKNITDKPMFLSTGLSSFDSIDNALSVISSNRTMEGVKLIHTRLSSCPSEVNLKAIESMRERFGNIIAFGNHCKNTNVMYAACSYEPTDYYFYVKHRIDNKVYFPWQKDSNHPDDLHAVYLDLVEQVCDNLIDLRSSLGSGQKKQTLNNIKGQR